MVLILCDFVSVTGHIVFLLNSSQVKLKYEFSKSFPVTADMFSKHDHS